MSDIVPSGWKTYDLGELALKIEGGGTPSRIEPAFWKGDLPWATVKDLKKVRLTSTLEFISVLGLDQSASKLIPANTMILASRMAVGKAVIFDCDVTINQDLKAFYPKKNLETEFLLQWYLSKSELIESLGTGSTVKGIKLDDIKTLPITLPPLPEQQKIAAILTSVDDVIEKTQAQIDKLKDLKTGMMQELLTRGVGVDGKPHTEFKDSPVGRIPKGWGCKTIEQLNISVLDGDRGKEYPKEKDFFEREHCLFLSAKNVTKKGFQFNLVMFITKEKDSALRKGKLKRGDIVITTRGTLGNIAYFNDEVPFKDIRINSGMAVIRNNKNEIDTEFLHILLHSPIINEQTELLAFGSAIPQLTIGLLKNLNIPVPSLYEQKSISKVLNSVSTKINLVETKLTSLQNTKKALMQDLLTGKVRVKVDS